MFWSLVNAQDLTFLLLWIAVSVRLLRQGQPFGSGLALSLCAAKFHLFVLLPLVVLRRQRLRPVAGLVAGGAVLLLISFVLAGPWWPWQLTEVLSRIKLQVGDRPAPNLCELASLALGGAEVKWLLAGGVVFAVWRIGRRTDFEYGLAAALAGGMLLSPHLFMQDLALLLPAALIVHSRATSSLARFSALFLLIPTFYLFELALPWPWGATIPATILLLLFAMTREASRAGSVMPGTHGNPGSLTPAPAPASHFNATPSSGISDPDRFRAKHPPKHSGSGEPRLVEWGAGCDRKLL